MFVLAISVPRIIHMNTIITGKKRIILMNMIKRVILMNMITTKKKEDMHMIMITKWR